MEMSRGLLVFAALLVAGTTAQFNNRDNFDRRDFDREFERERVSPIRPDLTVVACRGKPADVFFVLDSSSSIYVEDYERQREFVRQVVDRLDVDTEYTRVGALTYSDNYRVSFNLQDFRSKQELRSAINDRNVPYLTGLTNTAEAIRYVRTSEEFRPDVTRVIVVITDGYSRQPGLTNAEAETARREGFYMFVIGVGQYTDEREWRAVANDPDNSFMYNITNYNALDRLYNIIPNRICVLPPIILNTGNCLVREQSDLIFVAGPSEADNAFTSLSNIVNGIQDDQALLRLSLLLGSCKANDVPLSNPNLFCDNFGDSTPSLDTYTNLLKDMRNKARDARSERPQANQVAILFIDQQTMNLDRFGVLREARDLQFEGVDIFVVDMGVTTHQNFLRSIASGDDYVLSTRSQSMRDLESLLLRKSCDALNMRSTGFTPLPPS